MRGTQWISEAENKVRNLRVRTIERNLDVREEIARNVKRIMRRMEKAHAKQQEGETQGKEKGHGEYQEEDMK